MMNKTPYQKELQFFINFINHLHVTHHVFSLDDSFVSTTDLELRETLGIIKKAEIDWQTHIRRLIKPNTIMYLTDEFFCQYVIFPLEKTDNLLLSIGPYVTNDLSIEQRMEILEQKSIPPQWLPILKNYFRRVPVLSNEDGLVAALHTIADYMWGEDHYTSESIIQGLPNTLEPLAVPIDPQKRVDAFSNIKAIEQVYNAEKELLQAVSHGRSAKAKTLLANFPLFALEQRTEALRNLQNYTVVINTLLRKASEEGGVHPLYIDQLSSTFAHRIEGTTRADSFIELWNEMIQKYCALVNKHSIQKYSLPVQKVITRIDFDLAADLSLKATAQFLNLNASYLSKLFKTETGYTLTDYVNMKRMEHAAYLLANTYMPVSTIAQSCGILDDNYFTKLFKRYHQKTPTQFRQEHYTLRKP